MGLGPSGRSISALKNVFILFSYKVTFIMIIGTCDCDIRSNKSLGEPAVVAEWSEALSNSSRENALGPRFDAPLGITILIAQK